MCRLRRRVRREAAPAGGARAREKAEADLKRTEEKWPEVREMARTMRELRHRNRFAEQFADALGEGRRR